MGLGESTTTAIGQLSIARATPKLSEVLFCAEPRGFQAIATVPSNVHAVESCLMFCAKVQPFVALVGPSGCGKSTLIEASADRLASGSPQMRVFSVANLHQHHGPMDLPGAILLDDAQVALERPRLRQSLRLGLERRVRAGKPTMIAFSVPKLSRPIKLMLPLFREWSIAAITVPDAEERILIIRRMALLQNLHLDDVLVRILAKRMPGGGGALNGALQSLRLQAQQWVGPTATLRALGILNPFFTTGSGWDIRDEIADVAQSLYPNGEPSDFDEKLIYVMLRVANLQESDVARFFLMDQAEVYALGTRCRDRMRECAQLRQEIDQMVFAVINQLSS